MKFPININLPFWIIDPKNNLPSVSMTLMMVSFGLVLVSGGLFLANKITSMGPVLELFYTTAGLYFARRFSISGKEYGGDGESGK